MAKANNIITYIAKEDYYEKGFADRTEVGRLDMTGDASVQQVIRSIVEKERGQIDVLVNNAAYTMLEQQRIFLQKRFRRNSILIYLVFSE
jgi:NAD(P)-dependent dehydrogenase (short-subunit alcohol dehydrogenase family)